MHERARHLIDTLGLIPHPEGGWYRELFHSRIRVARGDDLRPGLTTIYFLLVRGTHSRWHRVRSDEAWHFYEGDPIELLTIEPADVAVRGAQLGPVAEYSQPVLVVHAGAWQAARPLGEYALVGCSVGPGFDFADFELLADLPDELGRFSGRLGEFRRLV
ncbi:MAG TPA: cupin domain-containing protein [Thermoanaerobaculia bacterium]|nr:cupin domain-containing protein [Thermoanaerobaculia bacterium]